MDPDAFADTLDTPGTNSAVIALLPQGRYSFPVGGGASVAVSVEVPASNIAFSISGASAVPFTPAPDGTIKLRNEWERGHIQFASVFRELGARLPNGIRESVFGWGVNATGGMEVYGKDNIVLGLAYGDGISRYVVDTVGLNLDAAPGPRRICRCGIATLRNVRQLPALLVPRGSIERDVSFCAGSEHGVPGGQHLSQEYLFLSQPNLESGG